MGRCNDILLKPLEKACIFCAFLALHLDNRTVQPTKPEIPKQEFQKFRDEKRNTVNGEHGKDQILLMLDQD